MTTRDLPQITSPLVVQEYPEKIPGSKSPYLPHTWKVLPPLAAPPAGEWTLPPLTTQTPLFAQFTLAGRKYLALFDATGGSQGFYDRLHLDLNGNGDLTDDPPIQGEVIPGKENSGNHNMMFPGMRVLLPDGILYRFRLRLHYHTDNKWDRVDLTQARSRTWIRLSSRTVLTGAFRLAGKAYRFMVADANCDGIFGNGRSPTIVHPIYKVLPAGGRADEFYLNNGAPFTMKDDRDLPGPFSLAGGLYDLRISGRRAVLTPYRGKQGFLNLSPGLVRLHLRNSSRTLIPFFKPGTRITVPMDRYQLHSYALTRKDRDGIPWQVETYVRHTPSGEIMAGRKEPLVTGPPYAMTVKATRKGKDLKLELTLTGRHGDRVVSITALESGGGSIPRSRLQPNRPLEPYFRLLDSQGREVASGVFHYSKWFFFLSSKTCPGPFPPGRYLFKCNYRLGPFAIGNHEVPLVLE